MTKENKTEETNFIRRVLKRDDKGSRIESYVVDWCRHDSVWNWSNWKLKGDDTTVFCLQPDFVIGAENTWQKQIDQRPNFGRS